MWRKRTKPPLGSRLGRGLDVRGLVGCWLLNEGRGPQLLDLTGRNPLQVVTSDPSRVWAGGPRGRSLALDAAASEYAERANPVGLPVGRAARTVCMWVRLANTDPGGVLLMYGNTGGGQIFSFEVLKSGGVQYVFSDNVSNVLSISGAEIPSAAAWHHLAFAFDGGSTYTYYIDGRLAKTGTFGTTINTAAPNVLRIGEFVTTPSGFTLPGRVEQVRIYDRALGAGEIWYQYLNRFNVVASRGIWPLLGPLPSPTLGFANPLPAPGSRLQSPGDVSIEVYPINPIHTVDGWTFTVDDVEYTADDSPLGGNGKLLTITPVARLGRTRHVSVTAEVAGVERSFSWEYSERQAYQSTPGPTEYLFWRSPAVPVPTNYLYSGADTVRVPTNYVTDVAGLLRTTPGPVDFLTAERSRGLLGYVPAVTDFVTSETEMAWGPSVGCHVTIADDQPFVAGAMIESRDRYDAPGVGASITSTEHGYGPGVGASVVLAERQWAAAVGAMVSLRDAQSLAVGADVRGIVVALLLTYRLRSQRMQTVDEGLL